MLATVFSSAVIGIDAYLVEVEVDIASGLPNFTTVGLPEASVKESKERVKAAIKKANELGAYIDTGNENDNGNALARISETFNGLDL